MNITIRPEIRTDYSAITQVNDLAFGQENEGNLVNLLRKRPDFRKELSLVAVFEGLLVGHILFSPIAIKGIGKSIASLSLAPMCVMPELQNMGIGSQLVEKGLETARKLGYTSVIVLGHKEFYPRFGFIPASQFQIQAPFVTDDDCFLAMELQEGALWDAKGRVEYPPEFEMVG